MVTARYLTNKFLKPMLEKQKAEAERQKAEAERREAEMRAEAFAEGRAEGIAQALTAGLAEGLAEGLAQERRLWTEWNRRRMDAEASGAPFDEPPPAS